MSKESKKQRMLAKILEKDDRYPLDAYNFVNMAVSIVSREIMAKRKSSSTTRHISGLQLLNGMRQLLLARYGCMAIDVLANWNIHCTDDIGDIVFNLAEVGILGTSENDSKEDFHNRFSFHSAFVAPYAPAKRLKPMPVITP